MIIDILLENVLTEIMRPNEIRDLDSIGPDYSLYILDKCNVLKVNYSNETTNIELLLNTEIIIKNPLNMALCSHSVALSNKSQLFIYDIKSGQLNEEVAIENEGTLNSMLFCHDGSMLFVHFCDNHIDKLVKFMFVEGKWEKRDEFLIENEILGSWKMAYVHGHLIIVSWGRSILIF